MTLLLKLACAVAFVVLIGLMFYSVNHDHAMRKAEAARDDAEMAATVADFHKAACELDVQLEKTRQKLCGTSKAKGAVCEHPFKPALRCP